MSKPFDDKSLPPVPDNGEGSAPRLTPEADARPVDAEVFDDLSPTVEKKVVPLALEWAPPGEFEEYRLIRLLGRGGTGLVYLAQDTVLERPVAVKFIPAVDSAELKAVLNEARAAARVQHPNVVAVYRVGQVENRAYLVSEYTRGTSLNRLEKPLPWRTAHQIARDLTRGLAAAHRRGVLHRDIKPGNSILTESGQAKLLDFGLAKLLDTGGGEDLTPVPHVPGPASAHVSGPERSSLSRLVGTPYYMSPEAWTGQSLSARSDIYSLGALLYELCAAKEPFRHIPFEELPLVVQTTQARPLAEVAPEVDPRFAAIVDRCLARDPLERFPSAEALLDALEEVGEGGSVQQALPEGNPYRGLRPFEAEHRALFFGRKRDLRDLLDRLRSEPFVLLTGDSGVGKSSLCAAGILPSVKDGWLEEGRRWSIARLIPGRHPLTALASAVAPVLGESEQALAQSLADDPKVLARNLRAKLDTAGGLVLYVDQFEEVVTLATPEEASRFAEVLAPIALGLSGVRLVASARSDFLTRLSGLPQLGEPIARSLYLVRPMSRDDVREAVVGPARVKGVSFESQALVDALVESTVAAGGGLPLLQFALAQLWEARDVRRGVITTASLGALGGVAGALARHADGVIDGLPADQRAAARILLLRLVTDEGTRARKTQDELTGNDPRYRAALEALVRGRLLVVRESDGGSNYEVAHEALLHGWATLGRWIAEDAELRAVRRRLDAAAGDWERLGQPRDALWGARPLAEAAALHEEELSAREQAFLAASRQGLRRARRRRQALAVGFLVAVVAAAGGTRLKTVLERNRAIARDFQLGTELLSAARARAEAEAAARAEAFRAFDLGATDAGERAWEQARAEAKEVDRRYAQAGESLERALLRGPDRQDVHDALADTLLERALRAERDRHEQARELLAQRLQLVDTSGTRWGKWTGQGGLELSLPAGAKVAVGRYVETPSGKLALEPVPGAAGPRLQLPSGSYLLTLSAPGKVETRLPVWLERGETLRLAPVLPDPAQVPQGFVYVPAGRFLFGSDAAEGIRQFFNAVPMHPLEQPAFLIARHETTWAEWLAFLEALPPEERARRTPGAAGSATTSFQRLERGPDGTWTLDFQPAGARMRARAGERLRYPGRQVRAEVDWLKMPVSGIDFDDAQAYAAWLDRSGRVPGARLCTEREWERAARGSDTRNYPHGNELAPGDANFDLTYGKQPDAFGPDEVGSHPASASPFGVMDLSGNVWEWVRASPGDGPVSRGSSFYFSANTCQVTNRELPEPTLRDPTVGLRVCANSHP
ncbi:MAG TPA: bifunctional serine/threonine-protein kinase/formylglycine-generating enzyme family protein [Longimicrobium sp.]|nr:bifunctional serine/threonine-protein kinase/formylglycine-generating enzyme family protein [Longimicrobium sp.]